MQFFFLLPNCSLPYLKVVQGERNKKESQKTFVLLDKLQFGPLGARAYNPRPKGFIAAIFLPLKQSRNKQTTTLYNHANS